MEEKQLQTRQTTLIEFQPDQVELIKKTVAKDATNDELKMFLYQCQTTGLNPLARQIYFMKRSGKVTMQVSIDGFRVIAERSGTYAGQDEPEFLEQDGKLVKATVKVYRFSPSGTRYQASVGVAFWDEYCPQSGQDFMWRKMPHTMLSKVAEALALRKAFPQDLSGLYTTDEMAQSESPIAESAADWQIRVIEEKMEIAKLADKDYNALRIRLSNGLTTEEATKAIEFIDQFIDPVNLSQKQINKKVNEAVRRENN